MMLEQNVLDCVISIKHLPGKHNQLDHGRRFGKPNKNPQWEKMSDWDRHNEMLKQYEGWEKSLTPEELQGIKVYTGSSYRPMNIALREKKSAGTYLDEQIKQASSALDKGKAPYTFTVSRVTHLSDDKWNAMQKNKGKTFTDPAFVSASIEDSSSFSSQKTFFTIHVPKGAKGAYVDNVSVNSGENEFLLPPGTKFKVLSTKEDSYGKRYIELGMATR